VRDTLKKIFYKHGYLLIVAALLYLISFVFSNYWFYESSPIRVQKQLELFLQKGEQNFETFIADSALLHTIINKKPDPEKALAYRNDNTGLFAYTKNDTGNLSIVFWNNNKVLPEQNDLKKPDGKYFSIYPNGEFEFIKKTLFIKGKQLTAVAVIPIYWNYFFKGNYLLQSGFPANPDIKKRYKIVSSNARFYIRNGDGRVLFGLKDKEKVPDTNPGAWSLALRILSVIFVLIFINVLAYEVVNRQGWVKGLAYLIVPVFLLRLLSYYFDFPFKFRGLELFDPAIYASNKVHPSLGDLLINVILLFWAVSFVKVVAINIFKNVADIKGKKGWVITAVLCIFLIVLSFTSAGVIRSLIIDSKISFDVTNFFSLTIYSWLSFIILCFITLTFFHISHIALLFIYKCANVPDYARYIIIATIGLAYLTFNLGSSSSLSNVIVLVWLLVYLFIMEFRQEDFFVPILRSSFFLIWIIFFAFSISAQIIYENRYVEFEQRKQAAEKLAVQADPSAETLMSIGITNINNNFLSTNFIRFRNEINNKIIKDSLINENFSGYLNKYDTRLYTYDKFYHPLFNDDSLSYGTLSSIMVNRSKKTENIDLYYYENELNEFSYLYKKDIRDARGYLQGFFFIVAELKKYKSEALFPELFKQVEDVATDLNVNYAYAIYNKGKIINNYGDFDFKSRISKNDYPKQEFYEKQVSGKSALWYNGGNNKLVIIVRSGSVFFEAITLFAYLFGSFLFIVVLFQAGHLLIQYKFRLHHIKNELRFNLRSQIQGAIIFLSLFSFLVIAIATISFYISRFSHTNEDRLVKAIEIMANEVQNQIAKHSIYDDVLKNSEASESSWLESTIKEISEIHSLDANFYTLNGDLKVSTQPYLYKKQILSQMMEPEAFYRLHYTNNIEVIQKENVSLFTFLSIYVPIKDESGEPYAYLNIPYLNTQKELNQEISNFLVTLICLNAFIFVIAGAISVLLTNRITGSFTLIANKMKDINLGRANEEIIWNTNDEIGALIKEYNKMVKKLDESAQALAKSEREGAWREMARQVAHEIKNPLTPMKLSIQYLERAIQDKHPNVEALSEKVSATLVEQIDQLAKIASDFSQFANIGNVKVEVFDVNEVLELLIHLYSANTKMNIVYNHPVKPAIISADRTQINRLFTNLFQNAIEASDGKPSVLIVINQETDANKLLINITDEGCGIPAEMHEKIFTPNFTTKTSGTGLGLAMCKGIVEKANGRIWFETIEGKGTTFHVLLPVVGFPG
jgi:two-component system nitrogen regulation sensor histidine kinase NtrY